MSLEFAPGWELNNTSLPKMTEESIRTKTLAALESLVTLDKQLTYLKNTTANTGELARTKVTKGLHQEQGHSIIPDSHVQLEIADYPYPKRFHLYFWHVTKNKKLDWYAYKLTHIDHANNKASVTVNIE